MNIIEIYNYLEASYEDYICYFVPIKDRRVGEVVIKAIDGDGFLPKVFIQLNPDFAQGIRTSEMIHKEIPIHENFKCFFKTLFYKHYHETIKYGCRDKLFIVTSGTSSG